MAMVSVMVWIAKGRLGQLERLVLQVHKAHKEQLVHKGQQGPMVKMVQRVHKVHKERLVHKDQQVLLVGI